MFGRQKQENEFKRYMRSKRSEFIVLTGRRRIGKTFLINELFHDKFTFYHTGGHRLSKEQQLASFANALQKFGETPYPPVINNWFEAFRLLEQVVANHKSKTPKKIIFLDEMPWIDTPKSEFVDALENFWNGWAAQQKNIMLIATGSATSWMADKLFNNVGGLHNRITHHIYLQPFNLQETEAYLRSEGCKWDKFQIVQAYMIFGGVPYYLSLIDPSLSLIQNVDLLFFQPKAQLKNEFDELYNALFTPSDGYVKVIEALASRHDGMTRGEIINATKLQGSSLSKILKNLIQCDFVIDYSHFKHTKQGKVYRLADYYSLFYLRFVANNNHRDLQRWSHIAATPKVSTWQGFTFELVCMQHIEQIKTALGIAGIETAVSTWRGDGMQIDMIIDRADRLINLCEMKFSKETIVITRDYASRIRNRTALFRAATKTRKGLINTFITTFGVMDGANSDVADKQLTMDCLFGNIR